MRIAFFGSSLVSAYWNGAATYYRGLLRALAGRGHAITFYEPDAFGRQQHRDMEDPPWARVVVYPADEGALVAALREAGDADLLVKTSGVGVFDALIEEMILDAGGPGSRVAFWDVDAPATLGRLADHPNDPFAQLIPRYDIVFTYGGGPRAVDGYLARGARHCVPIYNALDPETHHPVPPDPRLCRRPFVHRSPPAGSPGAGRGLLFEAGGGPARPAIPARRQRLGARGAAAERRAARLCVHAPAQSAQLLGALRAQRQS